MKRFLPLIFCLSACAHQVMPGTVTQSLPPSEAKVYFGRKPPPVGQAIGVFKTYCEGEGNAEHGPSCRKIRVGHGHVKESRKDYSIIELDRNSFVESGSFVEQE